MIRGSEALEEAFRGSHTPVLRAVVSVGERRLGTVEVADGDVRIDGGAFARRSGRVEVRPDREAREWLSVPGACLTVWRGVEGLSRGVPVLGGPVRAPRRGWGSASVQVDVECWGQRVVRDGFPAPRQSLPGATITQMMLVLWRESVPWCSWSDSSFDSTACPLLTWEESRADAIGDLGVSIGCESWIRPDALVVNRRVPSIYSGVDLWVREGVNLGEADELNDWSSAVNHVVVRSDSTGSPVSGEFADWDSATGISACGRHTKILSNSAVTTRAQARVAAESYVLRSQGARLSCEYTAAVHPGVEAGDVHQVRSRLRSQRFVVDTAEFELLGAGMRVSGRVPSVSDTLDAENQ